MKFVIYRTNVLLSFTDFSKISAYSIVFPNLVYHQRILMLTIWDHEIKIIDPDRKIQVTFPCISHLEQAMVRISPLELLANTGISLQKINKILPEESTLREYYYQSQVKLDLDHQLINSGVPLIVYDSRYRPASGDWHKFTTRFADL